jgi:diaminopimelate epimerase
MHFFKYQGTGNDFIILDGRNGVPGILPVQMLCDRRFGIGADGLMVLQQHPDFDFEMVYYNSDGNLSSMCGNGGRCLAHFAHFLGIGKAGKLDFIAMDGPHHAEVNGNMVDLGMRDVLAWEQRGDHVWVLNTGSPHYVDFQQEEIASMDLWNFARAIRFNNEFQAEGINVNVVRKLGANAIEMRTYERGVEDETLSCGTGVTAAALAFQLASGYEIPTVHVNTPGGDLEVLSTRTETGFTDIILRGPAVLVYSGDITT